jgi:hypothetical protein
VYVAAHAATVALTEYQRDLQHRLEIGARRRQPFVERPTVLEVESAGGMIARFDAIEQLAAGALAARRLNAADQPATGGRRSAMRLEAARPPGRSKPTEHSPTSRTQRIWYGSLAFRHSSPQPPSSSGKPPCGEARWTPA